MTNIKTAGGILVTGIAAAALVSLFSGTGPATGAAASGGAGPGTAAGATIPDETIVVIEKGARSKFVDVGTKGDSVGDYLLSRNTLLDEQGKRVGRVVTRCMLQFKPDLQCDGVYKLRGRGDIAFSNVVDTAKEPPVLGPLVGGDGDFANITGQLKLVADGDDLRTTLEIHHH